MKVDKTYTIRILLLHYWKKGFSARSAAVEICEVEGDKFVSKSAAIKWFQRFNSGNTDLNDESRSGRPSTVDSQAIMNSANANPCTSVRRLSDEVQIPKSSVHRKLLSHGKRNRRCKVVPHDLTPEQAEKRLQVCEQLLLYPNDERFLKTIVTCDEKWVYFRNPDLRNQWLSPNQSPIPVAKRQRFEHKVLLCVWWNYEGPIHFELVPNGRTITAQFYVEQLQRMYEILAAKYPALINRKRALLQQDNARPHVACQTKNKIRELEGIEVIPHPAYSPDLAPSDYYLFRSMAHYLQGKSFQNVEEVRTGITDFFISKPKEWYMNGIKELTGRWLKTIKHKGLYFED